MLQMQMMSFNLQQMLVQRGKKTVTVYFLLTFFSMKFLVLSSNYFCPKGGQKPFKKGGDRHKHCWPDLLIALM